MSFINRLLNRPVVLDLYTSRSEIFEFSKPVKSVRVFPAWWQNLPKQTMERIDTDPQNNMKGCVGFTSLFQRGIVIPMWTDVRVTVDAIGSSHVQWAHSDRASVITVHPAVQRGEYLPEQNYQHLKLESPWSARCSEDVNWLMVQATWNFDQPDKVIIPPGILDFKYQATTNVNLFMPRASEISTTVIEHGQPLVQLIPLTERRVVYRTHLVTQEKINELNLPPLWFIGAYKKSKKLRQSCPVGGGIK